MFKDKIDWHLDSAAKAYRAAKGIAEEDLAEEDEDWISRCAGAHIGFFMTWIIQHHFEGEIFKEDQEALEQVRTGKMAGIDFIFNYCDFRIIEEFMSDDIVDFVTQYYDQYLADFGDWVSSHTGSQVYSYAGNWDDYRKFSSVIDKAYQNYLAKKKGSFFSRFFRRNKHRN